MQFTVLDTESSYRKLLTAPDAAARAAIFAEELIAPFAGLTQIMGSADSSGIFREWGMWAEQFTSESGIRMAQNLDALAAADAWSQAASALEDGRTAFAPFAAHIPQRDGVFGLMLCDLSQMPLQRGYSGLGAIPGYIMTVYGVPDAYNLARIKGCTAHEFHHNILARVFPINMMTWTVGEYMVMEGLAESFAAELYGEENIGYYVTDFDASQMDATKATIKVGLEVTGFGAIRGYIFGDGIADANGGAFCIEKAGVPAFAGYAVGYHLVQAYLKRTGKSVAEATFIPAREIITESQFLD